MKRFLLLITGVILSNIAFTQNLSAIGRFEVDFIRGCAPLTIQVTDNSGSGVSVFQYEGSGSTETNLLTHTYTTPGTYTIIQTIQNLVPRQDTLVVEVFDPVPPSFQVFTCTNEEAIIIIDDTNYERYEVDYDTADPLNPILSVLPGQSVPQYTYPGPGTYNISVHGLYNNAFDNCGTATQNVTTVTTIPPATITGLQINSEDEISIDYTLPPNLAYRLEIAVNNNSGFQLVKNIDANTSQTSVSSLDTENRQYCLRISAVNVCDNSVVSSNIMCSVQLDAGAINNSNEVTWSAITTGMNNFEVFRDMNSILSPAVNITSYSDTTVTCGISYCYQVQGVYPQGISYSKEACVEAFSTDLPDALTDVSAIVTGSGIELEWILPPNFTPDFYEISRFNTEGEFSDVDTTSADQYTDANVITSETGACYEIGYTDTCGNEAPPTGRFCSIFLQVDVDEGGNAILNWNAFDGWELGVDHYEIEVLDQNDEVISQVNAGVVLTYTWSIQDTDDQIEKFRVYAVPVAMGLTRSQSNQVEITKEPVLVVPNAFTPDGDGLNDLFVVQGRFITSSLLKVFNKWGELIHVSDGNWDGSINGGSAPQGTYIFTVELTDEIGRTFVRNGQLTLLRH